MSTTLTTPPRPQVPPVPVRRFTVDEYHRMIQTGILGPNDRVELLEGWIVPKMPRKPPHDAIVSLILNRVLAPRLPDGWFARGQSAITTADSEPKPDLAVVRGAERDYLTRHPEPADMALVIEVSDTTLASDRSLKVRLYASAAIPVYWIVNLVDLRIEVFTNPTGPATSPSYRTRQDFGPADLVPLIIDGQDLGPIAGRDLLP
ncbi:MAG: Uma2 family endonuclease [Isosphaeraceae bacterium]